MIVFTGTSWHTEYLPIFHDIYNNILMKSKENVIQQKKTGWFGIPLYKSTQASPWYPMQCTYVFLVHLVVQLSKVNYAFSLEHYIGCRWLSFVLFVALLLHCFCIKRFSLPVWTCFYTREKNFCKTWFQVGMELKKVPKQGRDERTQEDYPASAKIHTRCSVVFLRSFISAFFYTFFSSIPTWNQVLQKLFSLVPVLFRGFLNQLLITCRRQTHYRAGDEPVLRRRRTRWKRAFKLKPHTHTHIHTASYQRLPYRP